MITLKKQLAIAALATAAAIMPSCEKEDNAPETTSNITNTPMDKHSLSKGLYMDLNDIIEEGKCYYTKDKSIQYKTIKVHRRKDTSKYFYIMIENLGIKLDTACFAYKDNEGYAEKYGRLYTWFSAKALSSKLAMRLPIINNKTGEIITQSAVSTGRLMNSEDLSDILSQDM